MKMKIAVALGLLALVPTVLAGDFGGGGGVTVGKTNGSETLKILAGDVGGIGLLISGRKNANEPLRIQEVLPGSPAARAGIQPSWFLISVDGTNVVSMSATEVVSRVRGTIGTSVTLELAGRVADEPYWVGVPMGSIDGTNIMRLSSNRPPVRLMRGSGNPSITPDLADPATIQTNRFTVKRGKMVVSEDHGVEITDQ